MSTPRLILGGLVLVLLAGAGVWAFRPDPLRVDLVTVRAGPMQVTVAAEGITRVREPYLVTAPTTGNTTRSPVQVGDPVVAGETVVAVIQPAEPAFLDARARAQAQAAVAEAAAAVRLSQINLAHAEADLTYAESQLQRNRELAARGVIPQRMLEDSQQLVDTRRAALEATRSEQEMREATLIRAEAQLVGPEGQVVAGQPGACCAEIRAPHSGTVLAVENPSARLVQAGEPLLTIGDLADLEVEVDLLSADAVGLQPGARALVERWGGETVLDAALRRIDPRGFTRVSALGIEEQRVRVLLDFTGPPEARDGLGDAFRVFVRIVTWETDDALQVPVSALFRQDGDWAVFVVEDGIARTVPIGLGRRTQTEAQIVAGLTAGQQVVAFPGDRVSDGTRVAPREVP